MAGLAIEIRGLEELKEKLNPADYKKAVNTSLMLGAGTARAVVKTYPPSPPASTYPRTGTLGRKWALQNVRWNVVRIGNNTPYGPFVQDRENQAWFHKRTGWKTTDDIAEQEEGKVVRDVERGIENYLRNI